MKIQMANGENICNIYHRWGVISPKNQWTRKKLQIKSW